MADRLQPIAMVTWAALGLWGWGATFGVGEVAAEEPEHGEITFEIKDDGEGNLNCVVQKPKGNQHADWINLKVTDPSAKLSIKDPILNPVSIGLWRLSRPPTSRRSDKPFPGRVYGTVTFLKGTQLVPCKETLLFKFRGDQDQAAYEWWVQNSRTELQELRAVMVERQRPKDESSEERDAERSKEEQQQQQQNDAQSSQGSRLERRRERRRMPDVLVHLPSGGVAPPYPSDVTEGTRLQIAVIERPGSDAGIKLKVEDCGPPETFRSMFGPEEDGEQRTFTGTKTSVGPGLLAPKEEGRLDLRLVKAKPFHLRAVGPTLRCGPTKMTYTIAPSGPETGNGKSTKNEGSGESTDNEGKHTLRVNPKYHIAAIVALGFDTARGQKFFAETVPHGDGMRREIIQEGTREGLIAYVGALWMIGGVDYHNMKPRNYFANLFVAVNPAAPFDDVAWGLTFTPSGGLGLSLGMTLHQSTELVDGFIPGSALPTGDPPTTTNWRNPDVGFFVGFSVDTNVFRALGKANEGAVAAAP